MYDWAVGWASRLGWELPLLRPSFPAEHGPLMVSGFLGNPDQPGVSRGARPTLGRCRTAAKWIGWP